MMKYYKIEEWMLQELHLRGNDLLVFAYIYSFHPNDYFGAIDDICSMTGVSRKTAFRSLEALAEKAILSKQGFRSDVRYCIGPMVKMILGKGQNDTPKGQNDTQYNNYKENYIKSYYSSKTRTREEWFQDVSDLLTLPLSEVTLLYDRYHLYCSTSDRPESKEHFINWAQTQNKPPTPSRPKTQDDALEENLRKMAASAQLGGLINKHNQTL